MDLPIASDATASNFQAGKDSTASVGAAWLRLAMLDHAPPARAGSISFFRLLPHFVHMAHHIIRKLALIVEADEPGSLCKPIAV
jgi:hypothetical protein